MKKNFM